MKTWVIGLVVVLVAAVAWKEMGKRGFDLESMQIGVEPVDERLLLGIQR